MEWIQGCNILTDSVHGLDVVLDKCLNHMLKLRRHWLGLGFLIQAIKFFPVDHSQHTRAESSRTESRIGDQLWER